MAKKEQPKKDPLVGEKDGVKVEFDRDHYFISFDFSKAAYSAVKKIDGAEFVQDAKAWRVPASEGLGEKVTALREVVSEVTADRAAVEAEALKSTPGVKVGRARTAAKVNRDTGEKTAPSYHGTVVSVGKRFVAQTAGSDYIVLHELESLGVPHDDNGKTRWEDWSPKVGENKSVFYSNGFGVVKERERVAEKSQEQAPAGDAPRRGRGRSREMENAPVR